MISRVKAHAKAASIKTTLVDLEAAIQGLAPETPGKEVLVELSERMHRKLNGLARMAANHFDEPVETFSGGTDKRDED